MDEATDILQFECNEPKSKIVRTVSPTQLSKDRIQFLWDKLKEFDTLFNDFVRGDYAAFVNHFIVQVDGQPMSAGLFWDVDDVGILLLKNIIPMQSAETHFVFWDRRFKGREGLCRGMLKYVFELYKFQRIEVRVPMYATDTLVAVERLGFVKEGRIRRSVLYKDDWFDVNLYSILPHEVEGGFKLLNEQGRHSRLTTCFDCGKVYDAAIYRAATRKRIMSKGKTTVEANNDGT